MDIVIRNGQLITMDAKRRILQGDLVMRGSQIVHVGARVKRVPRGARVIDADGGFVMPGLIQAHTHLCQALFRGEADDLSLIDWLKKRIWPMEAAHTESSLRASARIGLLEMQTSGVTSILDMGTVHHTHALLDEAANSGMRYWGGKCLMDDNRGKNPLSQQTRRVFAEVAELIQHWQNKSELLNYALCPRLAVACTKELLETTRDLQAQHGLLIHTHASESREEVQIVRLKTGLDNVDYLASLKMLNEKTVIAHAIHLSRREIRKLARTRTPIVHCPSSNLKLGSGIAKIPHYHEAGLTVGLGCDGAACNNSMDPFIEMRLAAILQKPFFGPESMPAQFALELATIRGAKVLGAENKIGSLEVGKQADVIIVDRSHPSVATVRNPYSALVYSCLGRDVRDVFTNGEEIVRNREHVTYDREAVNRQARRELTRLLARL